MEVPFNACTKTISASNPENVPTKMVTFVLFKKQREGIGNTHSVRVFSYVSQIQQFLQLKAAQKRH
jgi:hypothetical protein